MTLTSLVTLSAGLRAQHMLAEQDGDPCGAQRTELPLLHGQQQKGWGERKDALTALRYGSALSLRQRGQGVRQKTSAVSV